MNLIKVLFSLLILFAANPSLEGMQKPNETYNRLKPHITLKNVMLGTFGLGAACNLLTSSAYQSPKAYNDDDLYYGLYYDLCRAFFGQSFILGTISSSLACACKALNKMVYEYKNNGNMMQEQTKPSLTLPSIFKKTALFSTASFGIIFAFIAGLKLGYGIKLTSACISMANNSLK